MSERARNTLFFVAGAVLLSLYFYAARNLAPWGDYRGPYGDIIARRAVYERHATDIVNAINYDYRAFDTLGEEFILFTAVLGVSMLLRREEDAPTKPADQLEDRFGLSDAVRSVNLPALLVTTVFGFYIGLHGQLTPGGGFQAGVILATGVVLVYVCENTETFRRITSHAAVEVTESAGAGAYALIGIASLFAGMPFLCNFLGLGKTGDVFSSGTIALISACVGVEVTAAFLLVVYTYLEEIVTGAVPED
ncbi:MAG TPA: hydrogen gas-evolving membrane-bound hydrogenase subunit E [Acidobacteriaceae bacterium]|jgi:multicomponent Na+:H+ antiporter subunit B|nr:hydrogen gas-evolving membrane-bound hydrogenase subunit E [Acidobacteriaceae bacterium]